DRELPDASARASLVETTSYGTAETAAAVFPDGRRARKGLSVATDADSIGGSAAQSAARYARYSSGCSVSRREDPLGIRRVRLPGTRKVRTTVPRTFTGLSPGSTRVALIRAPGLGNRVARTNIPAGEMS